MQAEEGGIYFEILRKQYGGRMGKRTNAMPNQALGV